jgi:transposase
MPWLETVPVEQRERFIDDHRLGLYDMTELCGRYAISRKTGYKWLARYDAGGRPALQDRSRAPHSCPHKIAAPVEALLVAARRQHPDWGPEKLVQWLEPRHPDVAWPAISTAGDLLARHGLVRRAARIPTRASSRRPPQPPTISGPPTSRASSGPATGSTATRSR